MVKSPKTKKQPEESGGDNDEVEAREPERSDNDEASGDKSPASSNNASSDEDSVSSEKEAQEEASNAGEDDDDEEEEEALTNNKNLKDSTGPTEAKLQSSPSRTRKPARMEWKDANDKEDILSRYTTTPLEFTKREGGRKDVVVRRNDSMGGAVQGLERLRRKALESDATLQVGRLRNASKKKQQPFAYSTSFKEGPRRKREQPNDAGEGWFEMKATPMTDALKRDIALIETRNALDPKRFYKSADKIGKFLQVGTVVEGASEYYSSRLTKKQRKATLVEEVLADKESSQYALDKFKTLQEEKKKRVRFGGRKSKHKKSRKFF